MVTVDPSSSNVFFFGGGGIKWGYLELVNCASNEIQSEPIVNRSYGGGRDVFFFFERTAIVSIMVQLHYLPLAVSNSVSCSLKSLKRY